MEHLTPSGGLFQEQTMWWEDLPSHPGLFFIRGLPSKDGEDARSLSSHAKLPASDGPRGVGWLSPYIQGLVDHAGRLVFAETSGRVAWLLPTGEIVTVAGWTLTPNKTAVWVRKPLSAVRANQELRGAGAAFRGGAAPGFGRPMDVAFDRSNPFTYYVPDLTLNCIWRVTLGGLTLASGLDARPTSVDVDVLAGSCSESAGAGHADGVGGAARFNAPFGAAFARGALFVADSANHAIRRVDVTTGAVTTVWGRPDFAAVLAGRGAGLFDRADLRRVSQVAVTAGQAATGARPEIYWPAALRARSDGSLVLLEHGFGQVRGGCARLRAALLGSVDLPSSRFRFMQQSAAAAGGLTGQPKSSLRDQSLNLYPPDPPFGPRHARCQRSCQRQQPEIWYVQSVLMIYGTAW